MRLYAQNLLKQNLNYALPPARVSPAGLTPMSFKSSQTAPEVQKVCRNKDELGFSVPEVHNSGVPYLWHGYFRYIMCYKPVPPLGDFLNLMALHAKTYEIFKTS